MDSRRRAGATLAAPGALLDLTQVLRPGFPVFQALEALALERAASGRPITGAGVGVSARDGRIEIAALQPEPDIPLGILQLLPVAVCGPVEAIRVLGEEMEYRFLEKGQISAHSARWLESAFGIAVQHARFMTLTDLNAMFKLQLEHFGLLPLWELIDAGLGRRSTPLEVSGGDGQVFEWRDGVVRTAFQTFDHWAGTGLGRGVESARGQLAGGYAEWTRQLRQYLTTLTAHCIPVRFHLPDVPGEDLEGTWFVQAGGEAPPHSATVTEHSFAELGTVCVTTVRDGRLAHHYPLTASGLNAIHSAIREQGLGGGAVAYPGSIVYDPGRRSLMPDRDEPAARRSDT